MNGKIERFQIKELHGYINFDLKIKDNTLILVGENGSGKTTVLRLLYYLLSGQWNSIVQYKFQELCITINNNEFKLPHEWIEDTFAKVDQRLLRRLPYSIRRRFKELLEESKGGPIHPELEYICNKFSIPLRFVADQMDLFEDLPIRPGKKLDELLSNITKSITSQILYLPTYRRIEQELNLIFKGIDEERRHSTQFISSRDTNRTFVELIEFGMKDVQTVVDDTLKRLKDFDHENLNSLTQSYLRDVVDKRYTQVDIAEIRDASENTIRSVVDRIPEPILSATQKDHLFDKITAVRVEGGLDEHAKVICHYFLKLLHIQNELQKKEAQIRKFCEVCTQYMSKHKLFDYDSAAFTFSIKSREKTGKIGGIELRHLSSGEKQIVSLFSHLYLSGGESYFVLIDEPELSLSVPWQRRFLEDIKNGGFCSGLVAVTHSPFIYDNELKPYAHGLGEFEL